MIHNDVQNQLALLVKTSATPLIEVAQSPAETPQWVPGQRLPAHVIASLPNGRFHVMVEDQTLDMNLPRSTQPGNTLELVFVSNNPRPTFALMADVAKVLPPTGQQVELSPAGKYLGALIQQQNTTSTATITPSTPVLPGAPASIQQFASALKDAISNSGFFYESHQAQWVAGERPLDSLLKEPQGRLSNLLPNTTQLTQAVEGKPVPVEKPVIPGQGQVSNSVSEAGRVPVPQSSAGDLGALSSLSSATTTSIKDPVHPSVTNVVQQQLGMVDSRQVIWQGQVWPGQEMKWEIEEDGGRQHSYNEEEKSWNTRLHIDFPTLGGVTANLSLSSAGIKVDFSVVDESSVSMMKQETPSLLQSLEASGLKVMSLSVAHHGGS